MPGQPSSSHADEPSGGDGQGRRRAPDEALRLLVRHQWVREHDTPRVTVLAGSPRSGRAVWEEWLALAGRPRPAHPVFEQPARVDEAWLDRTARRAVELAVAAPRAPIALAVAPTLLDGWLGTREDRLAAVVREGIVRLSGTTRRTPPLRVAAPGGDPRFLRKARSLGELTLFEALEATPATRGRFELNALISVDFGGRPAEVDLLSRADENAIEIDGYHHFTDERGYRRDRRKDLVLQAHGYAVLRFLATDVQSNTRDAVRTVIELIGQRRRHRRIQR